MSETTLVQSKAEQVMKFVPYGSSDEIKLSVDIIQKIVAVPTRSGKTCSQRDAIKFMMMCQAKRLNPFEGDAFLIGYDGQNGAEFSLITAHQAFLKRAELHPEFDGMKSGLIVKENGKLAEIEGDFYTEDQTVVGGWATVFHKTRKYPTTRKLRVERFNKGFAQWKVDAAGMIVKCAESDALRSSFPTMLGGLYLREEIELNVGPAVRDMMVNETKRLAPTFAPVEDEIPMAGVIKPVAVASAQAAPPAQSSAPTVVESEAPAAAPEQETAAPVPTSLQQGLCDVLEGAGVSFEDFRDWLGGSGKVKDATALTGWMDIPDKVCVHLQKSPKELAAVVKLYGRKEETV